MNSIPLEDKEILRRTIYQWRHMPADMVVNPVFILMPVISDSGFGLAAQGHAD